MSITHVNRKQFLILQRIAKESGLNDFWLGGSITYKEIAEDLGVNFEVNDYDLAIIGDIKKFRSVLKILKSRRFSIIKSRSYYLKFNKIFQIIVSKKSIRYDIGIVKNINYLGHFNWESIFWHFPSGRIYDLYNSIESLRKRKLAPIVSINEENPFILASRLVNLCARFNVDFCKDKNLFSFLKALSKKIKSWGYKDYFHGVYAREHAYFNILQAIIKSSNRYLFIKKLQKVGLLEAVFPELKKFVIPANLNKELKDDASVRKIIYLFEHLLSNKPEKFKSFQERLKIINNRLT